jgi:CRP/FNR family cyclic AMP-dependent transcriptional regulator
VPLSVNTLLERSSLFRGLPISTLERVAALATNKIYAPDTVVFFRGDAGNSLYSVMRGRVLISAGTADGKEVFLNIMEAGDSFGEIALLDGSPRTATATTMMRTELLIIEREHFLSLLRAEPLLATHLIQLLCKRIRWTAEQIEDSALLSAPARLAKRLTSLARIHGQATPDGTRLTISQQELARFLSLSRQIVNQHLQCWKDRGWISLGRSSVTIIAARALQSLDRSP